MKSNHAAQVEIVLTTSFQWAQLREYQIFEIKRKQLKMWSSDSSDSELEFTGTKKKGNNLKNNTSPLSPISNSKLASSVSGSGNKKKSKKKKNRKKSTDQMPEESIVPVVEIVGGLSDNLLEKEVPVSSSQSSSEDETSEEDVGYGRLALGIDYSDVRGYDGKSAPQNGSQYLLAVMRETKKAPKVVVADEIKMKDKINKTDVVTYLDSFKNEVNIEGILKSQGPSCPFTPSQDCRSEKLKDFSLLRSKIEKWKLLLTKGVTRIKTENMKLPEIGNRVVWQRFCFSIKFEELVVSLKKNSDCTIEIILENYFDDLKGNYKEGSLIKEETDGDEYPLSPGSITTTAHVKTVNSSSSTVDDEISNKDGCQPLMSIMLSLSQKQVEQLILYNSEWITKYGFINRCQGEWLYALMSCVAKPLEPTTMADIRNICKSLIRVRNTFISKLSRSIDSQVNGEKMDQLSDDVKDLSIEEELEKPPSRSDEYINSLNLFIYLISDYFNQKDLVMELF